MFEFTDTYELKIDFERGSERPSRVFKAMSGMIDALNLLDKELVNSFAIRIESTLILEDVEVGSITARLRTVINAIDDEALKELDWKKAIGSFLVKGKQRLLKHLEDKSEIDNIEHVRELEGEIIQLAEETDVQKLPFYSPVQSKRLLESLSRLYTATSNLSQGDSAFYISNDGVVSIPQGILLPTQTIENMLTREMIQSRAEMILRVKKPDYLGTSMWDVQYNNRTISVKITDVSWLNRFQMREVDVRPGDALRAMVLVDVGYGYDNNVVAEHYTVTQVLDVIRNDSLTPRNLSIFDSNDKNNV